jgi:hypothetical protein
MNGASQDLAFTLSGGAEYAQPKKIPTSHIASRIGFPKIAVNNETRTAVIENSATIRRLFQAAF